MAEQTLRAYDKEVMRMAMLRHEETFKQQVSELHRLYRVQKIMMKDIELRRSQQWSQEISDDSNAVAIVNESEIELTLGPSSSRNCRRKKEIQFGLDSCPRFSSSSASSSSSHIYRAFNGHDRNTRDVEEKMRQPPWIFQIVSL